MFPAARPAMKEAIWVPYERPLRGVLNWLHLSGVEMLEAIQLTSTILPVPWALVPLTHQPREMKRAMIKALAVRQMESAFSGFWQTVRRSCLNPIQ